MNIFAGTGVALVTPFMKNQEIDEASLRRLVDHVIEGKVDYLVALGTTSEAATMSEAERCRVMEVVLEQNAGRVPVMVGIGGNHTAEIVANIQEFPYLKDCQAILSVVPYYNKPSQEGIYRHFRAIAGHSELPVFLYNIPGRSGVNMTADTVIRLAQDCGNIRGVKEASGNFQQVTDILAGTDPDFAVVSGDDGITLPLMAMGVKGVISVLANLFPSGFSEMVRLASENRFEEARLLHLRYAALYKALFAEGNPAGIKAALQAKGIIGENILRLPLVPVSAGLYAELDKLCQSM